MAVVRSQEKGDAERGRRKRRRSPSWAEAALPRRCSDDWLARAERKRLARLAWKRRMRALRGNTPPAVQERGTKKFAVGVSVVWWNAQSIAAATARLKGGCEASVEKWAWLRGQFEKGDRPAIILVGEVEGSLGELRRGIQRWARSFRYEPCFLPGEGGSQRAKHGTFSNKNGMVALLATEQVKRVRHLRVEERVLGVEYRVVGEDRTRAVCGLHGLSSEGD